MAGGLRFRCSLKGEKLMRPKAYPPRDFSNHRVTAPKAGKLQSLPGIELQVRCPRPRFRRDDSVLLLALAQFTRRWRYASHDGYHRDYQWAA